MMALAVFRTNPAEPSLSVLWGVALVATLTISGAAAFLSAVFFETEGEADGLDAFLSAAFVSLGLVWIPMVPGVLLARSCIRTGHAGFASAVGGGAVAGLPFLTVGYASIWSLALTYAAVFWLVLRLLAPDLVRHPERAE
jgi:hypothetical protein